MATLTVISIILGSIAAIIASVVVIWNQFIRPLFRGLKRMGEVTEVILKLPEWCESVDLSLRSLGPLKDEVIATRKLLEEHINDNDKHLV